MRQPITQNSEVSQTSAAAQKGCEGKSVAFVQVSRFELQPLPLGAIRLNDKWNVQEYRHESNDDSDLSQVTVGKNLFSCIPWAGAQDLRNLLNDAIHSGASNLHFDLKLLDNPVERNIHINVFILGDATVWLFISDQTLPPL